MKKTQKLMALCLVMAMSVSGIIVANAGNNNEDIKITAPTMGISTYAVKGSFNDYFPNEFVAKAVADSMGKAPSDTVTIWQLMNDVKTLSLDGKKLNTTKLSNIDGLEYLNSLESLEFNNFHDGVIFNDTLDYSKNLKNLVLESVYNTSIPEGLLQSGIKNYYISFVDVRVFLPWSVDVPQAFVDAANKKEITLFVGGTGISNIQLEYTIGDDFDTIANVDDLIKRIIEIEDVQRPKGDISLAIVKPGVNWRDYFILKYYHDGKYEDIYDFVNAFNDKVKEELKESGKFSLYFGMDNGNYPNANFSNAHYYIPLTVKKAPISKWIEGGAIASNGSNVRFKGSINGEFNEGANALTAEQLESLNIEMYVDNNQLSSFKNNILSCSVTVKNDEIVSVAIAGLAVAGDFSSFFMITLV